MYLLLTSLVSGVLASCIPFMGKDPRNFQGAPYHSCAASFFCCQAVREEMAIVDIRVVVFGLITPFSLHVRLSSL